MACISAAVSAVGTTIVPSRIPASSSSTACQIHAGTVARLASQLLIVSSRSSGLSAPAEMPNSMNSIRSGYLLIPTPPSARPRLVMPPLNVPLTTASTAL